MSIQISSKDSYAYAELLEILSFTNINLVNKIPKKLISLFQENASSVYEHHLNRNIPLEEQDISSETATLITLISLNYWCETEEEKNEIRKVLAKNEKIEKEELEKKYNPNNIFQNNSIQVTQTTPPNENTQSNLPIAVSTLPWYSKILNTIKNLISKITKKSN